MCISRTEGEGEGEEGKGGGKVFLGCVMSQQHVYLKDGGRGGGGGSGRMGVEEERCFLDA